MKFIKYGMKSIMNNKMPLVSVVIPTHNRSIMLRRALDSVLNQSYENIEIIISDDGSTDDTQEMLTIYSDNRIKIYKNDVARGACNARNNAINMATGTYVTFLDDDDEYLPTRIEDMVNVYNEKYAYISAGYYLKISKNRVDEAKYNRKSITLKDILYRHSIGSVLFLTKLNYIKEVNGFDESLPSSQDYDLLLKLHLLKGEGQYLDKPLAIIHIEHEYDRITTSKNKFKGHWLFYKKYKYFFDIGQRKNKIYELLRYKNKNITLRHILWLVPNEFMSQALKLYVSKKFPSIKKIQTFYYNKSKP